jgi:tyrosine-protein kinase Etk/Wzc
LNKELVQVEEKMEGYEDYFESFTLQNKSSDLTLDLKIQLPQLMWLIRSDTA